MSQSFLVTFRIGVGVFVIATHRVTVIHCFTILSCRNCFVGVLRGLIILLVCVDGVANTWGVSYTLSCWNGFIGSGVLRSSAVGDVVSTNRSIGRIGYFLLWSWDDTGSVVCFSSSHVLLTCSRTWNVLLLSSLDICCSLVSPSLYLKRLLRIMNDLSE